LLDSLLQEKPKLTINFNHGCQGINGFQACADS